MNDSPIQLAPDRLAQVADRAAHVLSEVARVFVGGEDVPRLLLTSLLRSMSPFQVTLTLPADVEALRVNGLLVVLPSVTSMSPEFVVASSVVTFVIVSGAPETPMPLPALSRTAVPPPLITPPALVRICPEPAVPLELIPATMLPT